ncbi:hypothetical protein NRY95_07875 [Xanthomonas campestris pv. phormiicola]|nr:hypothetical protein [Xanthomonas campestris pv. phormiicola]UYC17860.1 hypothetical protein NRY95_07875 [Xanthomonas campestris pv. phormiicola]
MLGRPYHLLGDFQRRLAQQFARLLERRFNQRCAASFAIGASTIGAFTAASDDGTWHGYRDATGSIIVQIDRSLLLAMLGYHYGDSGDIAAMLSSAETETERRFAGGINQQLLDAFALCGGASSGCFVASRTLPHGDYRVVSIAVREERLGLDGYIRLALDDAWLAHLFSAVLPARTAAPAQPPPPLRERLPIRIHAQIASLELSFEALTRLCAGDILPIPNATSADLMVGDLHMYRARVADKHGVLCLTSFEPAE